MPFIRRHRLLHNGATVIIGVSGGADSTLLLHYLHSIRKSWQLRLIAITIDHGLRGKESEQDVCFVKELCETLDIEFVGEQVDVKAYKRQSQAGTQLAARNLRYLLFERLMSDYQADYLALAHHGDDQVETVMMRIAQHTNPSLLKGIPVKRCLAKGEIIRPFLCIAKDTIYEYCHMYEISFREDPTNQSDDYTRNFYRNHILPLLKEKSPSVHRHVQHLTERVTEDEKYLVEESKKLIQRLVTISSVNRTVTFSISSFVKHPIALQRRAFHLILGYLYDKVPEGLSIKHEEDFFALLHQDKANVKIDFPSSLKAMKNYDDFIFFFESNMVHASLEEKHITVPGVTTLTNGDLIKTWITTNACSEDSSSLQVPLERAELFPLSVRARKPGDRINIKGLGGSKKIKNLFIDEKIPLYKRDHWPLLVAKDQTILWVIGLRKAEIMTPKHSQKFVCIEYQEQTDQEA